MDIRILKEVEICAEISEAILQCMHKSYPNGWEVFPDGRYWKGNVPLYSAVMFAGKNVCANVAVVDRVIRIGNEEFRIAGIGSVCVHPDYRGKALNKSVLNAAMDEAEKAGFDFGLLFTGESIKKVYEQAGWIEITGQKFVYIQESRQLEMAKEQVQMYYPLGRKDFPPGLVNLLGVDW